MMILMHFLNQYPAITDSDFHCYYQEEKHADEEEDDTLLQYYSEPGSSEHLYTNIIQRARFYRKLNIILNYLWRHQQLISSLFEHKIYLMYQNRCLCYKSSSTRGIFSSSIYDTNSAPKVSQNTPSIFKNCRCSTSQHNMYLCPLYKKEQVSLKNGQYNIFTNPVIGCDVFDESQFKNKKYVCYGGNHLEALCTNPDCKSAFVCSKKDCIECKNESHLGCQRVHIQGIAHLASLHASKNKDFYKSILDTTSILQKTLADVKYNLKSLLFYGDLEQSDIATMKKIQNSFTIFKDTKGVSGAQVKQLYDNLRSSSNKFMPNDQFLVLDNYLKEIKEVQKKIYETHYILKEYITKKKTPEELVEPLEDNRYFDSQIISTKQFSELLNRKWMVESFNMPIELQLLFRASEHEFKTQAFHEHCNGIEDTFTLIQTEFGKVIGGFTHYRWNQVTDGEWVNDKGRKSFLLLFDRKQKRFPSCDQKLIKCQATLGPCFGEDIMISDKCNENPSSSAFPQTYNHFFAPSANSQRQTELFCGAKKGNQFKIKEYEVFKVIFKQ